MSKHPYELDENGHIKISPLLNWRSSLVRGSVVMLFMEVARDLDQYKKKVGEIDQVGLHPKQALQLAEDLKLAAEKAIKGAPEGVLLN